MQTACDTLSSTNHRIQSPTNNNKLIVLGCGITGSTHATLNPKISIVQSIQHPEVSVHDIGKSRQG
ncbi:hypothetical protein DSUL_20022 [Desulfovibrionales bacterium]